jgi:hypothetical protein
MSLLFDERRRIKAIKFLVLGRHKTQPQRKFCLASDAKFTKFS